MKGENIVCFAKDWSENPTSNNHVMRQLARDNQVLWLNSVSTRAPSLTSGRDLRKIVHKLSGCLKGARQVEERLWVYTPIVLPLPHSRLATALNRAILRVTLRMLRRKVGMAEYQLWTFLPNVVDYIQGLDASVVVYYCVDEWSKFSYVDGPRIAAAEQRLCKHADVVFTTSHALLESKGGYNPETHLATHGVHFDLFSSALEGATPLGPELESLPGPILGYYGTIQDWVDLGLIDYLARRHPEWTIVLIGNKLVGTSTLDDCPNVHFLGRKPHSELPHYCKGFAVGMIPYLQNEWSFNANPLKLREYLCAGLPVVSTALPEVAYYKDRCYIGDTYEAFERGVEAALREDTPELRKQRSEAMRAETWERKVAQLCATVTRVKGKRQSR